MATVLNTILMGVTAVSVIPLVKSFLPVPESPATHVVRIGFGGLNVSVDAPDGLSGPVPALALYDVRGELVGEADTGDLMAPAGGFGERKVESTVTPEYIKLTATEDDPVCISYIAMTSSSGDQRVWSAGNAKECGIPWYPSPDLHPKTEFRPPCFWMSRKADRVPSRAGASWKMTDFAPEDKDAGQGLANQWREDPDTLCRAPARQQFWKTVKSPDSCIPIYENQLRFNEDGTDADRDYIINGNRQNCLNPGKVDNNVSLYGDDGRRIVDPHAPFTPDPRFRQPKPPAIPDDAKLSDTVDLGTLGKRQDRRRASHRDHEKCEHELVVSEADGVSTREVCESVNSWGPDIVSLEEGLYCDMCEHELYEVCTKRIQTGCWDMETKALRGVSSGVSKREGGAGPKVFRNIHHWK